MLARMWGEGNPHTMMIGMKIGVSTVENNMEASQKTINRTTI